MRLNIRKILVAEMSQLESQAKALFRKRPFTADDAIRLQSILDRVRANYVTLGRIDAEREVDALDRATNPLRIALENAPLLLTLFFLVRGSMVMRTEKISVLRKIEQSFDELTIMYPMICTSQIGANCKLPDQEERQLDRQARAKLPAPRMPEPRMPELFF